MTNVASDIRELRESYQEARADIEKGYGVEREIGLAALRLEATHTYRQLATTGRGLTDDDLLPLKEYVQNLVGGDGPEQTMSWLDNQAKSLARSVLSSLTVSLVGGVAVGGFATALGIVAAAAASAERFGAALVSALFGGGAVAVTVIRSAYYAGKAGHEAVIQSWSWAEALGKESDRALAKARALEVTLWSAVTGAPWRYQTFTAHARTRAQFLVGAALALLVVGGLLVIYGAVNALSTRMGPTVTTVSTTP